MHRRKLLALLDDYEARYGTSDEERTACERMRAFVEAHEDCFERNCVPGHITGSAWVLDPTRERVLLTHHRKLDIWVQLGGHSDGETDPAKVALAEATEESGLEVELLAPEIFDIDIHEIPARGDEPAHLHYDVRFALGALVSVSWRGSNAPVSTHCSKSLTILSGNRPAGGISTPSYRNASIKGLCSGLPGTMAGPESPPCSNAWAESNRRLPLISFDVAAWHS